MNNTTSLLIIAHGSRREQSNIEVANLVDKIRAEANEEYLSITHAFLELAEPNISDAVDVCIAKGATHILVVPYFLSAGRHVQHDIPEEVTIKQAQYPHVSLTITPHLGSVPSMVETLLSMATVQE
jgi:sirohydrochlorin ferrochelatase